MQQVIPSGRFVIKIDDGNMRLVVCAGNRGIIGANLGFYLSKYVSGIVD